ncbi:MAG: InlB B-repeat-containing protein, partial [Clostridiales bacterium]|nr:InlB B-repeat-containing protein [Clostridiales bacterium]
MATIVLTASGEASVSDFSLVLNEYGTDSPEVSIALSSSSEEPGTGEGEEEEPTAYTITLDANGGTVEPSTLTVTTGSTLSDLPTPTREGYQFDGWFDVDGTEYTTETVYELESDLTLTAQWSAYVAQIGETQYTTLADAFAAAVDGDTVELLADVTLDSAVAISTDISVSLTSAGSNTYTITRSGRSMRMLYVTKATLTLSNVTLDGAYSEIDTNTYSMVEVTSGGTVIMNDGVTMQNAVCSYQARGGAVTVSGSGTFTMNGGTVTGCGSSKSSGSTSSAGSNPGGAICVYGGSSTSLTATTTFTMNGGTIENCFGLRGGAVYVGNAATKVTVQFIMNGGTIKNCVAATSLDGSITGYGGAIYVMGKGSSGVSVPTVYINGGEITGCKAYEYGAALSTMNSGSSTVGNYYAGAYVIMGGYIHDNATTGGDPSSWHGNGIFVATDRGGRVASSLILGGDARIEDDIYLEKTTTMNVLDTFTGYAKIYCGTRSEGRVVAYAVDAEGNASTATGTIAANLLEVYGFLNDDGEVYADPSYTIAVNPDDNSQYILGTPITVTYTDGVEDEEVFADQTFTVIAGNATPTIEDPTRSGYTFAGWTPELAETVTESVTYAATWTINSYTVTYTDGVDDEELFADQSYTVEYGSARVYKSDAPHATTSVELGGRRL